VPVPRGTFPRPSGVNPFTILDYDGHPVFTQVEIVSRYPVDEDGADVVELLGWVRRDPTLLPDSITRYPVVLFHPNPPDADSLEHVRLEVDELLRDPNAVEITTTDCFGNVYFCRPFVGSPDEIMHHGPVHAEVRNYRNMLPRPGSGPNALRTSWACTPT